MAKRSEHESAVIWTERCYMALHSSVLQIPTLVPAALILSLNPSIRMLTQYTNRSRLISSSDTTKLSRFEPLINQSINAITNISLLLRTTSVCMTSRFVFTTKQLRLTYNNVTTAPPFIQIKVTYDNRSLEYEVVSKPVKELKTITLKLI